ncbi:MAG: hypothetical protein WCN87_02170, partial [Chlamydiota bacterium]
PLEPADILRIDPESHSLDIPSLASLQARIAACQERGEKAYTFTDYLGITYFSWPDNTIQVICSEFTYKPCYRKLTFADGASFYTRNVHRGSSTYRVSNVEVSIADPDSADRYQKASAGPRKSI